MTFANFKKIIVDTLTIKFDKAFGLDIGDRSIEIIELEKFFRFSVVTYGRAELPAGIVENGKIINQNSLAENLKKLLKEAKPRQVSTNKVIVSLPASQIFMECFEVDFMLKASALTKVISDKVSLLLPINLDKTYWDFLEKPLADKTKKLIMFVCIPKDVANSYVRFCNSIGLEVVSLCWESLDLARILLRSSAKQSLIMDIGSGSTNLSFFDSNDRINMAISIPIAGEHFTQSISDKLGISLPEAEALKIKFGFTDSPENTIRPLILPVLEDMLAETRQIINYYEEVFKQKLDDIYVIGGSALLPAINESISFSLKKEVQTVTSSFSLNLKSFTANNFLLFVNVISLGMLGASREFKNINFLKKMPASEVNAVSKLNLFNMGYLSRVNTIRTIINNKFVLVTLIVFIGITFLILLTQTKGFDYSDPAFLPSIVAPVKPRAIPNISTTTTITTTTTTPNTLINSKTNAR